MSQISDTIDFRKVDYDHSTYKFSLIHPDNGRTTTTLSGTAQRDIKFTLPTDAFNLSRSYVCMDYKIPAQGASKFTWVFSDVLGIVNQIRLRTSANVELEKLDYVPQFTKMLKGDIPLTDFLTMDEEEVLHPSRGETKSLAFYDEKVGPVNPNGPVYVKCVSGRDDEGKLAPNVESEVIRIRFPLGLLKGTIFGEDNSLYFPESLSLHVLLGAYGNIGFSSEAADDPTSTPADLNTVPVMTLNDIRLLLAVEQNKRISADLQASVNGPGMRVRVPVTYGIQTAFGEGAVKQTVTIRADSGNGLKLRRFKHTVIPIEESNVRYNSSNVISLANPAPLNVSTYYVMVDNQRVSGEMNLDCKDDYDWLANREHLKDSVIQNKLMYKLEWHHQEDFSGLREDPYDDIHGTPKKNMSGGLDLLTKERKIDIFTTMTSNFARTHYTFLECERELFIQKNGIGFELNASPTTV